MDSETISSAQDLVRYLNGVRPKVIEDGMGPADRNRFSQPEVAFAQSTQAFPASRERVINLLRRVQSLEVAVLQHNRGVLDETEFEEEEIENSVGIIDKLRDSINRTLNRYSKRYAFDLSPDPLSPTVLEVASSYSAAIPYGESLSVETICELAESGLIGRVMECVCGSWFFGIRADQKSCSAKCRLKRFENTEDARTKRKKYMRNYYRLKKSGKVK